jgi:hypothetical protein
VGGGFDFGFDLGFDLVMAYDPAPIFDALHSKLAASGFAHSLIAEPTDPPPQPTAAVMFTGIQLTEHTLSGSSGIIIFTIRFFFDAISESRAMKEKDLASVTLGIMEDLAGDYDLGDASVRNVMPGQAATGGFQTIGNMIYRVCDLRVEVMVNDLVTHVR